MLQALAHYIYKLELANNMKGLLTNYIPEQKTATQIEQKEAKLSVAIKEAEEKLTMLKSELKRQEEYGEHANTSIEESVACLHKEMEKLAEIKQVINGKEKTLAGLIHDIKSFEAMQKAMKQELISAELSHQQAIRELDNTLVSRRKTTEQVIAALEAERKQAETDTEKAKGVLKQKVSEGENLGAVLVQQDAVIQSNDAKIKEQKTYLAGLLFSQADASVQVNKAISDAKNAEKERDTLAVVIQSAKETLERLNGDIAVAKKELSETVKKSSQMVAKEKKLDDLAKKLVKLYKDVGVELTID